MPKPDRKERLAEQLRANLKKRKQQERAREALNEGEKPENGKDDNLQDRRSSANHLDLDGE